MRSQDESESFFDHRFLWVFLAGLWRQGGALLVTVSQSHGKKGGGGVFLVLARQHFHWLQGAAGRGVWVLINLLCAKWG